MAQFPLDSTDIRRELEGLLDSPDLNWAADPHGTLEKAERTVALARQLEDHEAAAMGLRFAGLAHLKSSNYAPALAHFNQALEIFETLNEVRQIIACRLEIGEVHTSLGNYADALTEFEASLELSHAHDRPSGAEVSLSHIASVHTGLGNLWTALEYQRRSLALSEQLEHRSGIGWNRRHIGELTVRLVEAQEPEVQLHPGIQDLEVALEIGRIVEDRALVVESLNCLAHARAVQGERDAAFAANRQALEAARSFADEALVARSLVQAGVLHLRFHDPGAALEPLRAALTVLEDLGAKAEIARVHRELSSAYKAREEYKLALHHFECHHEYDAIVRHQAAERQATALAVKLDLERTRHEAEVQRIRNLELASANRELERIAREDALTGLANRRSLEERAAAMFARAREAGEALTIAIADIDHFKAINDRFSHAVGDQVLAMLADILRRHCRATDLAARSGGEEFVLVIPGVHGEGAFEVCDRFRQAVQHHDWSVIHAGLEVTLSLGFCDDTTLENPKRMLAAADERLYEAKRDGRNRVRPQPR